MTIMRGGRNERRNSRHFHRGGIPTTTPVTQVVMALEVEMMVLEYLEVNFKSFVSFAE
jgi:hypothetical protein